MRRRSNPNVLAMELRLFCLGPPIWWRPDIETFCFPQYWPFVREIHHASVGLHKKDPVMRSCDVFLMLLAWTNCWTKSRIETP